MATKKKEELSQKEDTISTISSVSSVRNKNGKQVYFGKSPNLAIKVSEEIIKESVERNSGHCMVAEAIQEHCAGARYVAVDIQTIRFTDLYKKERYTYLTPRSVQIANLVIPRTLLCGMPVEWQEKFAVLLDEAKETYDPFEINDNYMVTLRDRKKRFTKDPLADYRHPPKLPYR